jgi:hypothetical protein
MPIVQPRHHAGDRLAPNAANPHVPRRRALARTGFRTLTAVTVLGLVPLALTTPPAQAATTCTGDICLVDNSVDTPLGPVTLRVSSANVVTVTLNPITRTVVFGIPFTFPPGPPSGPGYTRTTIDTAGGIINIDEILIPPGPPGRLALPSLSLVSIHPPSPCRAQTTGSTVTFTPVTAVIPPGPPL